MKHIIILLAIFLSGNILLKAQDTTKVLVNVPQMPAFPGGEDGLIQFLQKNIKYPATARDKNVQGTVIAQFIVKSDGYIDVDLIKILHPVGSGCDEEVIKVIKKMPKWSPGIDKGVAVPVYFNLPVVFTIEGEYNTTTEPKFIAVRKYKDVDEYMRKNVKYPADARKQNLKGEVVLKVTIDKTGKPVKVLVIQPLSESCDTEAIKMAQHMPTWMPAWENGNPIDSQIKLTVPFPPK